MALTSKTFKYSIIIIGILGCLFIGSILFSILYESKKDISNEEPYVLFLNIPQKLKAVSTVRWHKDNLRFSPYSLEVNDDSYHNDEDFKSVKHYQPGDIITFHAAKSYFSNHVGESYYLMARDTLDTGEIIEFQYYYTPNTLPFD
ncbi:hypothetical protein ADIWIN_3379 [Winogradskyella psychrotolerans RS-3]|uniref:Uncharacterized protein n=1 Tax=Winogradskyella psychrotolerans RS-3 TaxID=641526 RepID=S7VMW9_9FLAO|nr:hypothetical protein [Winogradskyella psychrotolerans]EPR70732.1 hypothetical protein ADIWIN_3379 [Winogradskyella psychrotolerans RS-3]